MSVASVDKEALHKLLFVKGLDKNTKEMAISEDKHLIAKGREFIKNFNQDSSDIESIIEPIAKDKTPSQSQD